MTGMTTDTNNFANSVYPSTLAMASELLAAGVDRDRILQHIYNHFGENRLRLKGHMFKDLMRVTPDGVAYMVLDRATQEEYQVAEGDTEGFVNEPLSIAGVKMSILAKEDTDRIRISIRSKKGTSANRCAKAHFYSNIVISAPQLSMDDAWAAAEMSGIAEDIRRMPMGMHTIISEGSGGISGGQRQRLMIARAIAPKPRILMFDEATSALDNITQRIVSESLEKLKCTRIVIAHRLSTIKECDRIIYLEKGKIVEDGTYDELIALNGKFAELVERQRLDT